MTVYKTGSAFKAALTRLLRNMSHVTGRPVAELHREFFMQRFLARIFTDPTVPWIVKGGGGLLIRLPGARYSRDLDLLHTTADLEQAVTELREIAGTSKIDPFLFDIALKTRLTGHTEGATLNATAFFGAMRLAQPIPIDLSIGRELIGDIERLVPRPVIEIADVAPLPKFAVYPIADQIADKVAAMYELHRGGGTPSTRYHDLVDLLLLTRAYPVDAAKTRAAFARERARRGNVALPSSICSPGPGWTIGYRNEARSSTLPTDLHVLEAALGSVGECLNPLLDGTVTAGEWNPESRYWTT
ncbi:nucleotidyl transferase AbiEii/AbiGii toxin family protein [Nocardia sp. BMG111209]|uniref:nucleotidyl transferase AbiEii/AbiGii toxin family protein n=1 Tax=Nocardia sp. BMG111209 TaxID=1160137 RepID=UPI000365BE2D|nr:nucleotidyl transferase AbiEii/AbiGii toxin family protein [Nocardia sp. BMG111209]